MSDEELKEEDADDSVVMIGEKVSPDEVRTEETKQEEKPEEGLTEAPAAASNSEEEEEDEERQSDEKELKEAAETESSSTPAVNEWEHFDVVCSPISMCRNDKI